VRREVFVADCSALVQQDQSFEVTFGTALTQPLNKPFKIAERRPCRALATAMTSGPELHSQPFGQGATIIEPE
jgi:hypothetical protein